jgi:lipopolysaccharide export system permease protein
MATRILNLYVLSQVLPASGLALLVFSVIFLLGNVMQLIELIVTKGVGIGSVLSILVLTMPFLLVYIIPMSLLIAVLLTFLRLSSDHEITAMKNAGISLFQIAKPVMAMALAAYLLTSLVAIWAQPRGERTLKTLLHTLAFEQASLHLKERVFLSDFKNLVLYINRIDANQTLYDLFVYDNRNEKNPQTIVAKKGYLNTDQARKTLSLFLEEGSINTLEKNLGAAQKIEFRNYNLLLDLRPLLAEEKKRQLSETEMTLGQLSQSIAAFKGKKDKKYYLLRLEWHRKFSLPFACLVLTLTAIPLGIQGRFSGRSWAVVLGMVLSIFYYLLYSMFFNFGERGWIHPGLGLWIPNFFIGGLGLLIFYLTAKETTLFQAFFARMSGVTRWLRR